MTTSELMDTVTVDFSRKALEMWITLFNASNVRNADGNLVQLRLDEYAPGKATLYEEVSE